MGEGWVKESATEWEYINRKVYGYIAQINAVEPIDENYFVTVSTGTFYRNKYGVLVGRNSKTAVEKFVESIEEAKAVVEGIIAEKEEK
jgi:hypothetical protein